MSEHAVELYYRKFGKPEQPTLCLLHGLFGSANNWMGIVKYLQDDFHIITPDLRNHGRSPHHDGMDYTLMAGDLLELFDRLGINGVNLLGHSMGGKVAMWSALQQPERIEKLVVADIAPVAYEHGFDNVFEGLCGLPLDRIQHREEADQLLAGWVAEKGVRQYLLQNLVKQHQGWSWRFNLDVLRKSISHLTGFPEPGRRIFAGEVLFIHGEKSDYVRDSHRESMGRLFPHYRQRMLHGAGHWLYAEQPQLFAQAVKGFL
ncbi:MAG: alpha/beta fold hydrolase [Candidatus Thiodiazotropha sp.]